MVEVVASLSQAGPDRQQSLQFDIAEVVGLVLDGPVIVAMADQPTGAALWALLGRLHL
jgi:hypothetical protein